MIIVIISFRSDFVDGVLSLLRLTGLITIQCSLAFSALMLSLPAVVHAAWDKAAWRAGSLEVAESRPADALGLPPSAAMMAARMDDLPVPLRPTIKFRRGPKSSEKLAWDLKFSRWMWSRAPFSKPTRRRRTPVLDNVDMTADEEGGSLAFEHTTSVSCVPTPPTLERCFFLGGWGAVG